VLQGLFGLSEERKTHVYDDHDNPIETTTEAQAVEGQVQEDGTIERGASKSHRIQTRFTYKYDERGNWRERVTSQRYGSNPDFTPTSIDRREIAY